MNVEFHLQHFDGPLDLLLHLIDKAEVDIYDIPISEITDQYLEYVSSMQELHLDIASEFLVMAATLLSIKSRMLLPKPPVMEIDEELFGEEGEDPRAELVAKLLEYRKYKEVAEELREKELERSLVYSREPLDLEPFLPQVKENPVLGLHVADLVLAFQKVIKRSKRRDSVARIRRDDISVKDRMVEVLDYLERRGGRMLFSQLFDSELTREDIVVSFLALLELMKRKQIICFQYELFEDIVIQAREDGMAVGISADEIDY